MAQRAQGREGLARVVSYEAMFLLD